MGATQEDLDYASDAQRIKDFRASLIGADAATALMLTSNAISTFGGLIAAREQAKADTRAAQARQDADRRAAVADRARQAALADRAFRATHPAFAALKSRIVASETAISLATSPADFDTAEQILADAFQAATTSVALGISSVLAA